MNLKDLPVIKSDERGMIYDCGKLKLVVRKKGTTSADHSHADPEIDYLIKGEIELTIGTETKKVSAPMKIECPANIYHKLVALSDIELLVDRSGE